MRVCETHKKICYPSQTRAIRVALASSRKRGTPLRVYFHKACGSHHLTKQPLRQDVAS
jgi:hypothetical protein